MEENELLKHNKEIVIRINILHEKIKWLETKRGELLDEIKAPCDYCRLDGLYRCEACENSFYEGFNDKDWF